MREGKPLGEKNAVQVWTRDGRALDPVHNVPDSEVLDYEEMPFRDGNVGMVTVTPERER